MFKNSILALAAAASVAAAVAPVGVEARTRHRHHVYQGRNGHYNCRRKDSTVGTVIGAGAGALIGGAVTHGAVGPIVGAVGGGLAGRQIARRCR